MNGLEVLRSLAAEVAHVRPDEVPDLLGELARVEALLRLRLTERSSPVTAPEQLLKVDEAVQRTGMSRRWLYANADTLPFAHRTSGRSVRFSSRGIDRWLAKKALKHSPA